MIACNVSSVVPGVLLIIVVLLASLYSVNTESKSLAKGVSKSSYLGKTNSSSLFIALMTAIKASVLLTINRARLLSK